MAWVVPFVGAILTFFLPILQKWLTDLLTSAREELAARPKPVPPPLVPEDRVGMVFETARKKLGRWGWGKRRKHRVLDACERHCLAHAGELERASEGGPQVQMGPAAIEQLAKLF